ncbi:MAG TPA: polysaccharide biosynthesis C-terminal domain-containing protein, partial [Solirubrobacteraceae bacterium]|nr:polysaccharide biosynthesis C-terminal domain-containing protein [Solirubrobacteraceae bacterium]
MTQQASAPAGVAEDDLLDTPDAGVAAIRGGAVRIGGYVLGLGFSVVSSAVLLRHLGVVATGDYVTVLSLVAVAGGVVEAGLATIGVRELSTLPGPAARGFFRSLSGLRLVVSSIALLFAAALALLSGYSSTLVFGTILASIGFLAQTTQVSYMLPLLARLSLTWVTAIEVLKQLATALGIVALVVVGAPLLPFWATTIPAGLIATALGAVLIRRSMPLAPAFDRAVWRSLLRRTLPYSLASAVGVVYLRLAILIMSHVASAQQTGYYGASFRIVEVLFVVPQLIVGSTLPIFSRAARDDPGRLDYALGRTFDACLLLGLAAGLSLITGASFIVGVVAGPRFGPAAGVLRIQGLALIATFVGAVFAFGLLSLGRYREVLLINLTVVVLSGVLTGLLASRYGAMGAASATAAVEVLYAAMLAVAVVRAGRRPRVSLRGMSRAVLAALLGAGALLPAG